jgi:hypothetical protein
MDSVHCIYEIPTQHVTHYSSIAVPDGFSPDPDPTIQNVRSSSYPR